MMFEVSSENNQQVLCVEVPDLTVKCLWTNVLVLLQLLLPLLTVPTALSGLELCDPRHRLMVAMVSGFFGVFAELLLPGFAALCHYWPVLQAVATLPLLLLLSYWW